MQYEPTPIHHESIAYEAHYDPNFDSFFRPEFEHSDDDDEGYLEDQDD